MADTPSSGANERKNLPPQGIWKMVEALGVPANEVQLYEKYVPADKRKSKAAIHVLPVQEGSARKGYVIEFRGPVTETKTVVSESVVHDGEVDAQVPPDMAARVVAHLLVGKCNPRPERVYFNDGESAPAPKRSDENDPRRKVYFNPAKEGDFVKSIRRDVRDGPLMSLATPKDPNYYADMRHLMTQASVVQGVLERFKPLSGVRVYPEIDDPSKRRVEFRFRGGLPVPVMDKLTAFLNAEGMEASLLLVPKMGGSIKMPPVHISATMPEKITTRFFTSFLGLAKEITEAMPPEGKLVPPAKPAVPIAKILAKGPKPGKAPPPGLEATEIVDWSGIIRDVEDANQKTHVDDELRRKETRPRNRGRAGDTEAE